VSLLASGPVPAKQGEADARALGIAPRTLMRARKKLNVIAEKGGMEAGWTWRLPTEECQPPPKNATPESGILRENWHSSAPEEAPTDPPKGDR
jgi:putative DNA primase/helicase